MGHRGTEGVVFNWCWSWQGKIEIHYTQWPKTILQCQSNNMVQKIAIYHKMEEEKNYNMPAVDNNYVVKLKASIAY